MFIVRSCLLIIILTDFIIINRLMDVFLFNFFKDANRMLIFMLLSRWSAGESWHSTQDSQDQVFLITTHLYGVWTISDCEVLFSPVWHFRAVSLCLFLSCIILACYSLPPAPLTISLVFRLFMLIAACPDLCLRDVYVSGLSVLSLTQLIDLVCFWPWLIKAANVSACLWLNVTVITKVINGIFFFFHFVKMIFFKQFN